MERINQARDSEFRVIRYYNMDKTEVNHNADKMITTFKSLTNDFSTNECLRIEEQDMGRDKYSNCYAYVSDAVSLQFPTYQIIVGENAYAVTDYNEFSDSNKKFEFLLGQLFFGAYELKP